MINFNPSTYQTAIKNWLLNAVTSLLVNATAGSGKTTTLVWLASLLNGKRLLFLSFGRDIVATLAARCPSATCKTYNALGFAAIRGRFGRRYIKVDKDKTKKILWDRPDFAKGSDGKRTADYFMYFNFVNRLVGLAKNAGIGVLVPDERDQWLRLITHHDLMFDSAKANEDRAIEIARDTLKTSNLRSEQGTIDFDDQLYLVLLWDLKLDTFDFVFVDEFQDSNAVQHAMLLRLRKIDGSTRFLLVGDEKQAIYGFRGADAEAMHKAKAMFNAETLPLSICYRCARAIVDKAREIVPAIEAAPNAPAGKVESLESYCADTFNASDLILCRNAAPLVTLAYQFIKKSIACHILGREIGKGLIQLVERMEATGIDDLDAKLEEYRQRETGKLLDKGRAAQAEAINDRCDCVKLFIDNLGESHRTIDDLKLAIDKLFNDPRKGTYYSGNALTLATIHKAKGLEFPRVFILDWQLLPSKYATQDWQLEQERNLQFVAITRAMNELYFIESGRWEEKQSSTDSNSLGQSNP